MRNEREIVTLSSLLPFSPLSCFLISLVFFCCFLFSPFLLFPDLHFVSLLPLFNLFTFSFPSLVVFASHTSAISSYVVILPSFLDSYLSPPPALSLLFDFSLSLSLALLLRRLPLCFSSSPLFFSSLFPLTASHASFRSFPLRSLSVFFPFSPSTSLFPRRDPGCPGVTRGHQRAGQIGFSRRDVSRRRMSSIH